MARIQDQDLFHGAALTQLVEHPSFKALNKKSGTYGHYLLNQDRQLFVKYATGKQTWQFTFSPAEVALMHDHGSQRATEVILVCGQETICSLT